MAEAHKRLEKIINYILENFKYENGDIIITNHFHKNKIGKPIGKTINRDGYVMVSILDRYYRRNRVIFLMVNRYLPKIVDHINGDRKDDRIENLREATFSQNIMNRKKPRPEIATSKYKGVCYCKERNLWKSVICINGKSIFIGRFKSEIKAAEAYDEKAKSIYGDFAILNFK